MRGPGNVFPLPIQRSGNSLSWKTPTGQEKWCGAPSNWKTDPTETWHKAVFCNIVRKCHQSQWPPRFPDMTPLDFFFWGRGSKTLYIVKECRMRKNCVTESSELQSALPMKWLPVPGEKLSIFLMCVVSLMVPILRSAEHIRNFVRSSVWSCVDIFNKV